MTAAVFRVRVEAGWPWAVLTGLVVAAFDLSCRLAAPLGGGVGETAGVPRSVVDVLLSRSQTALSRSFYDQADLYFHRGLPHARPVGFQDSVFQRLHRRISPDVVTHREGVSAVELLPWLRFALRTDPHNVELYEVAAFWLDQAAHRPDLAIDLLVEARRINPLRYEIPFALARLHLKAGRWDDARRELDAGLAFWPRPRQADDAGARSDRAAMLMYRGLIEEAAGDAARAIRSYREAMALSPAFENLRRRVEPLERGATPSVLASQFLRGMLRSRNEERAVACPRCADGAHNGEPHDHEH